MPLSTNAKKTLISKKVGKKNTTPCPFVHAETLFESQRPTLYAVAFNPYCEGSYFATAGDNRITVYECGGSKPGSKIRLLRQLHDPDKYEQFYAITWAYNTDHEEHVVVVGGSRGIIRVFSADTGKQLINLQGHGEAINELRVCPTDSMIVASASKDLTARLWHIRHSQCLAILGGVEGHRDQVISVDFDLSANYIATASMDHAVKLWDIGQDSVQNRIQAAYDALGGQLSTSIEEVHFPVASTRDLHTNYVDCVRIIGDFIFSKACEDSIHIWKFGKFDEGVAGCGNPTKPETFSAQTAVLSLPEAAMWFIKFEVDVEHNFLASGNTIGDLYVWDLRKGIPTENSCWKLLGGERTHGRTIRQVTFSPDGKTIIAVGADGLVARYVRRSGSPTKSPKKF